MSLRTRVVGLIGLVLIFGVLMGSLAAGFGAKRALEAELQAAMTGGDLTVRSAFEDLPRSDHPDRDLRQLIATFNGNRHVKAGLIGAKGEVLISSAHETAPAPAPAWFTRLLGRPPPDIRIGAPAPVGERVLVLSPISDLDIGVLWTEFYGTVAALSVSALVGLTLVYLAIGVALRPLRALSGAFVRIGAGDYQARAAADGPKELRALQRGFNDMAERLAAISSRNRTLEEQILTLQDEERADLARDLHDEIGPHLFAVNVDAEVAGRLVGTDQQARIVEHVRSIQASVGHMQRLVREILGRLRPTRATELGLNAAVLDLVAFWTARAPGVAIACDLLPDEDGMDEALKDTAYRVIQEGLNNAVRHATPAHVAVRMRRNGRDAVEVSIRDDGAPAHALGPGGGGFGIIGMRERVRSAGGTLTIDKGAAGGGWTVSAQLPLKAQPTAPDPEADR